MIRVQQTRLLCPKCRTYTTIFRKKNKLKKDGHYKYLYCYICKETHNFIELNKCYSEEKIDEMIKEMKGE